MQSIPRMTKVYSSNVHRANRLLTLNSSGALEAEVSRLVRLRPEEVCHIPRALDFFLTKEALESDAPELPHVLTWARCSPIRALSLLCQRTLPTHPLTAQGGGGRVSATNLMV